jgi:hypothetical protein
LRDRLFCINAAIPIAVPDPKIVNGSGMGSPSGGVEGITTIGGTGSKGGAIDWEGLERLLSSPLEVRTTGKGDFVGFSGEEYLLTQR